MPGTGLARDYGALQRFGWKFVLPVLRLLAPNVNGTRRSGRALARLVTDPQLERVTGRYFQGFRAGLIAFTAAVMGGIGNLKGAVLGGLIIGIIEQISDNRIGSSWTPAIVFAYLVMIMVFRPQGLLGEETREAG